MCQMIVLLVSVILEIYDVRIHFDLMTPNKAEMNHVKGTIEEAVFGILFIEDDLELMSKVMRLK